MAGFVGGSFVVGQRLVCDLFGRHVELWRRRVQRKMNWRRVVAVWQTKCHDGSKDR